MSVNGLSRLWFIVVSLLGACADQDDHPADVYAQRVAAVLDRPVQTEVDALPVYPSRRALKITLERIDINVLDFARLHTCDMGGLVGARNSSLGRLQQASQRFVYELAWLDAAQTCINEGQDWLQPIYSEKQARLPAVLWNATFATDELATAMGATPAPWQAAKTGLMMRDLADLFRGLTDGSAQPEAARLEAILQDGAAFVRIGRQRAAWAQLRAALHGVADAVVQRQPPICLSGAPNTRSDRLLNVFRRYYLQDWQPDIAAMMSTDRSWVETLATLIDVLQPTAPPAFHAWYDAALNPQVEQSEWRRTQAAVVDHAAAWQDFLKQCGVDVTALREV